MRLKGINKTGFKFVYTHIPIKCKFGFHSYEIKLGSFIDTGANKIVDLIWHSCVDCNKTVLKCIYKEL